MYLEKLESLPSVEVCGFTHENAGDSPVRLVVENAPSYFQLDLTTEEASDLVLLLTAAVGEVIAAQQVSEL